MRILTEKKEIAHALNLGKYPVLSINLDDTEQNPYRDESYVKGCRTRVAWDSNNPRYEGMATDGYVYIETYESESKYGISGRGACLKANFGLEDVLNDVDRANSPLVHKGQVVAVVHYSKKQRYYFVRMMRVSDRIDIHCSTVATLKDIDE